MNDDSSKRSTIGGIVRGTRRASMGGGAILIGIVLFLILRGLGTPGLGPGLGPAGSSETSSATDDAPAAVSTDVPDEEGSAVSTKSKGDGLNEDERKSVGVEILTVLIDGHNYLLGIPTSSEMLYRPTELKRIVELAQKVKGDSNGIRVRILRRESSRARTEVEITTELNHVGITQDEIVMPKEFVSDAPADKDLSSPR